MPKIDLYSIFKTPLRIALRIYFKKIYLINSHRAPIGKKTIYALNHPTSFVDPILLVTQTKPFLYFLIRGDVFKKGLAEKALNSIHGIPVFRKTDASNSSDKNRATFDKVADKLHEGASVMVMPEGSTNKLRRLRPFKKGFAHMAFNYYKKYNMDDVQIVPVSLSYSDPTRFRSVVHIHFSKPLLLKDYIADYEKEPMDTINRMKDDLYKAMRSDIVHIEKDENLDLVDRGIKMVHRSYPFTLLPVKDTPRELLDLEMQVSETVNNMESDKRDEILGLMDSYEKDLKKYNTADKVIARDSSFNPLQLIFNLLLAPLGLLGYIANFLPLVAGNSLANKMMKRDEFRCSVKIGAAMIFYMLYCLIITLVLSLVFSFKWGIVALVGLPALGMLFIYFRGAWKRNITSFKALFVAKEAKSELKKKRSEILAHFAS